MTDIVLEADDAENGEDGEGTAAGIGRRIDQAETFRRTGSKSLSAESGGFGHRAHAVAGP